MAALVCAAAYWKRDLWMLRATANTRTAQPAVQQSGAPPVAPGLNTVDLDGQLQIRWNRNSPAIAQATDGVLRVRGGAHPASRSRWIETIFFLGFFTIARQSERVDVSLQLNQPDGQAVREVTSFIGELPDAKPSAQEKPAVHAKPDELANEVTKVKADLDAEIRHNRKIQKSVDFLAKQLHDQQRARLLNQAPDNKK